MEGMVFDIQRFCTNDGPGIRTCIFLKGCPLHCLWCHNPESHSVQPAISYHERLCIHCGACAAVCAKHIFRADGTHIVDRSACCACGRCVDACPANALSLVGKLWSVESLCAEARKDAAFYQQSGGGVTISGGEPLAQPHFLLALLKALKAEGFHTAVETCGYADWATLQILLEWTNCFLYDIKETDDDCHARFTGVRSERILKNLHLLSDAGAQIILRCPLVPGYNVRKDHLQKIGQLAQSLSGVIRVEVEPYHPLGNRKAKQLGLPCMADEIPIPTNEEVCDWIGHIAAFTDKPVVKA